MNSRNGRRQTGPRVWPSFVAACRAPHSSRSEGWGTPPLGSSTHTLVCPPPFPSEYLFSRLQRRRFPAVVFAALKGLNMTAQGFRPGYRERSRIKALKGRNREMRWRRDRSRLAPRSLCRPFRAWIDERSRDPGRCPGLSYLALSGLGRADHPHYDPLWQTAEELPTKKAAGGRVCCPERAELFCPFRTGIAALAAGEYLLHGRSPRECQSPASMPTRAHSIRPPSIHRCKRLKSYRASISAAWRAGTRAPLPTLATGGQRYLFNGLLRVGMGDGGGVVEEAFEFS